MFLFRYPLLSTSVGSRKGTIGFTRGIIWQTQ